jgi:hypothetical protein
LLTLVPVPAHAVQLLAAPRSLSTPAMGTPAVSSLVDKVRSWRLAMPVGRAIAWIGTHHPPGLKQDGSSHSWGPHVDAVTGYGYAGPSNPAWQSANLEIEVAAAANGTSVMRADAVMVWLDPVPVRDNATGPRMRVTVASGCPKSAAGYSDITNQGTDLARRLLPAGKPTAGLECTYYGLNGPRWQLRKQVHLTAAAAQRLASTMSRVSVSHVLGGRVNCPLGDDSVEIIALSYPRRPDVDLWISLGGCSTVRNGIIVANEG